MRYFDYDALCQRFKFVKQEKFNQMYFIIPFEIKGDTGKSFSMKAHLYGMIPDEQEPNVFLETGVKIEGRGSSKYHSPCYRMQQSILSGYEIGYRFTDPGQRLLVGTVKYEDHIYPIFSTLKDWNVEPSIVIKNELLNHSKFKKKTYVLHVDGAYYKTTCDPLKDAMDASASSIKKESYKEINEKMGFHEQNRSKDRSIESFLQKKTNEFCSHLYKGTYLLTYIGKEIAFDTNFSPYSDQRNSIVVNANKTKINNPTELVHTAEKYKFAMKDQHPIIDEILIVKDPALNGTVPNEFHPKERVKIVSPVEKRSSIKGLEGVIVEKIKSKPMYRVKFLDYFVDSLCTEEMERIQ